jgi:hypothetical protein
MNAQKKILTPQELQYQRKRSKLVRLRIACRLIFMTAVAGTVSANALHSQLHPTEYGIYFTTAPPVIVMLTWEMVSRIPSRINASKFMRYVRPIVTTAILMGAAYLSYWDQKEVVARYVPGGRDLAMILPLLVDGLAIIASVSIMELGEQIEEVSTRLMGATIRTSIPAPRGEDSERPSAPKGNAPASIKERIALLLAQKPGMAVKELATAANTSTSYAYAVKRELEKAINGGLQMN